MGFALPFYLKKLSLAALIGRNPSPDRSLEWRWILKSWLPFIAITVAILHPCLADEPAGSRRTVVLAVTSDLHGWLSTGSLFPLEKLRGILHVGPIIEALRRDYPQLILLDAGDTLQGSPTNYYFNYHALSDQPLPIVKLMNRLQYDAVVLGNHDLEPPLAVLRKNLRGSRFPWLAANLLREDGIPFLRPYHILERQGVLIGVLGLITPGTQMWINESHLENLEFQDMFAATKKWVPLLKEEHHVDLLIGLFHSGHNASYDQWASLNEGVPIANAAGLVADYQEGMDLIISGHAHRAYPKRRTANLRKFRVPVVSPGFWGMGVSVIKFFLEERQGKWITEKMEFEFLHASPAVSADLQDLISPDIEQVRQYLETPTEVQLFAIPSREEFYQCGTALSHQAIAGSPGAPKLSLLPRWKWHEIPAQELQLPLKRLHLFRWLPYDNFLIQTRLYGRQIHILLRSYQRLLEEKKYRSGSLLIPGGFQAHLRKNRGTPSLKLILNEQTMSPSESYPVWLTNYHWNGGGGMRGEALAHASQEIAESRQTLRDLVFSYLQFFSGELPPACATFLKKIKAS